MRATTCLVSVFTALALAGCGGGGGGSSSTSSTGTSSTGTSSTGTSSTGTSSTGTSSTGTSSTGTSSTGTSSSGTSSTGTSSTGTSSTGTSSTGTTSSGSNQLAVTVEQEPDINSYITANVPFVTVTVCDAAGNCSTVDHVLLDTGSYGLRVFASTLASNVQLAAMTASSGAAIGECASFVSGSIWGPVRYATVKLGPKTASNVPIQVMADPSFAASTTSVGASQTACPNASMSTGEQQLGAKGVLGVGLFKNDGQSYYACTSSSCSAVAPPAQVSNPVASFASDNNGVILTLPAATAVQASLTGVLTFGVDTQSDNILSGYTVLPASPQGYITVAMNGTNYPASFIDSGSNAYFLALSGVPVDSNGFFAPAQSTSYPATLSAGTGSYAATVTVQATPSEPLGIAVFPYLAAPFGSSRTQDMGLPFFYGKSVAYAINGTVTSHGVGPYYAIH